jgi:hypothetical protein
MRCFKPLLVSLTLAALFPLASFGQPATNSFAGPQSGLERIRELGLDRLVVEIEFAKHPVGGIGDKEGNLRWQSGTVARTTERRWSDGFNVQVDQAQAEKLLGTLARSGFFENCQTSRPSGRGFFYFISVSASTNDRGWKSWIGWWPVLWRPADVEMLAEVLADIPGKDASDLRQNVAALARSWRENEADPKALETRLAEVEGVLVAWTTNSPAARARYKDVWPVLLPHLLRSKSPPVRYEALLMLRDNYLRPDLEPTVVQILDQLLNQIPDDDHAWERMVACEVLGASGSRKSIEVLLRALCDPYFRNYRVFAAGHSSEGVNATWLRADGALRRITGAAPTEDQSRPSEFSDRDKVREAWVKWWEQNRAKVGEDGRLRP